MALISKEDLLDFSSKSRTNNMISNSIATRLVEYLIYSHKTGSLPEDSVYSKVGITYDAPYYVVWGKLEKGGSHILKFDKTIVAFDTDAGIDTFSASDTLREYLDACINRVDEEALFIEIQLGKRYLTEVRFGTEEYLQEEFKNFLDEENKRFKSENDANLLERFPCNFDTSEGILKWFTDRKISTENIHILGSK